MFHELLDAAKLKIISKVIVYVNMLHELLDVGRRYIENIDWGSCLCKCYSYISYWKPPC
jgi:hypothetical protein